MDIASFKTIDEYLNYVSPELLSLLQSKNMVVSGSTALYFYMRLHGINNPRFEPDDVDIYLSKKDFDKNEFGNLVQKWLPDYRHDLRNYVFLENRTNNTEITYQHYISFIHAIYSTWDKNSCKMHEGYKPKPKVQFIVLNDDNSKTCIDTFDFDFNRVYYDGTSFFTKCHQHILQKKCVVKTLSTCIYVINTVSFYMEYIDKIKRFCDCKDVQKLKRMGYSLDNDKDPCRVLRRIVKYKMRGFSIDFDIKLDFYTLYHIQEKTLSLLKNKKSFTLHCTSGADKSDFLECLEKESILSYIDIRKMTPHYQIFQHDIFHELIMKAMHPSRILQFIDW